MQGNFKRVLVTGGNQGIGFGIIEGLLDTQRNHQYQILMTTRSIENGQKAVEELSSQFSNANEIDIVQLDILDDNSIDSLIEKLKTEGKSLDVLVNNAGIMINGNLQLPLIKQTMDTNYFQTRKLTQKLLDASLLSENGKIINVSSGLGQLNKLKKRNPETLTILSKYQSELTMSTLDEIAERAMLEMAENSLRDKWPGSVYSLSKLLLSIWTFLLSKENEVVKKNNIQVYSCCPGWCKTRLTKGTSASRSIQEGAKTPVFLIDSLEYNVDASKQGLFFSDEEVKSIE